ncbi:MAG: hypothetical protein GX364_04415 [Firmicutes bacterium]|nr:hypothetical protein [Bacillota bacterium]
MATCPECNKQLAEDARFCGSCGAEIKKTIVCRSCGAKVEAEFFFCQNCGASTQAESKPAKPEKAEQPEIPGQSEIPGQPEISESQARPESPARSESPAGSESPARSESQAIPGSPAGSGKKTLSRWLLWGGIALVALSAVAYILISIMGDGLITSVSSGKKEKITSNYALYIKDDEIYYTEVPGIEPRQITTNFFPDNLSEYLGNDYILGNYCTVSRDGKKLFFPDKNDGLPDYGLPLYYCYLDKPDQDTVKIDSEVYFYTINDAGDIVTYLKSEEGVLYQYHLKENKNRKIGNNISYFHVSDDGKKIAYMSNDSIYLESDGEDRKKITADARVQGEGSGLEAFNFYVTDDFETVYYIKDDSLYRDIAGKGREKIASDVHSIIRFYDTEEIYYLKNAAPIDLMDFVHDDMKASDDNLIDLESFWWDDDDDAYYQKLERDELREELATYSSEISIHPLCYYDGSEEKVITDSFFFRSYYRLDATYLSTFTVSDDRPIIAFRTYDQSTFTRVKLSEIVTRYDVNELIEESFYSSSDQLVAIGGTTTVIEQNSAQDFHIDGNGKTIMFIDNMPEHDYHGDLYKMSISGNTVQAPELYDSDVSSHWGYFTETGKFIYFKNVKTPYGCDLYIDQEKIDHDVDCTNTRYIEDSDEMIYITDWDQVSEETGRGTLKIYKQGKTERIADDVYAFDLTPKRELLYLKDYSPTGYKGDLYLYKNGKNEKIDYDVGSIIPINHDKSKTSIWLSNGYM